MDRLKALIYLEIRQFINSIKNTLRHPKRLIPLLLITLWIASSLISNIIFTVSRTGNLEPDIHVLQKVPSEIIEAGVFLLLSIGSLFTLYGAFNSGLMIFAIAQIDFMFPTPIKRTHVLLVKLFKDYLKYIFYILFFFLFAAPGLYGLIGISVYPLGLVTVIALIGLVLLIINLAHTINIIFTFRYERMKRTGIIIKALLVIALISAFVYGLYQYFITGDVVDSVLMAARSPILSIIFAPVRWCTTLTLAPLFGMIAEDWHNLGFLWALTAGSFILLLSRKENIYEPALGVSVQYAKRRRAMRSGNYSDLQIDALREKGKKRTGKFSIPAFGCGASALLWKNLLIKYRVSSTQRIVIIAMLFTAIFAAVYLAKNEAVLKYTPVMLLYIAFVLSLMLQADIRADIKHANIIKSMPIAAWRIILMGVLSSVIYLTVSILVVAAALWALLPQSRGELMIACMIVVPFLGFANTSVSTISSLLYPDTNDQAQNYLSGIISLLLVSIAMMPALVFGILSLGIFKASFYTAAMIISVANIIMGAAGISISGLIFRKFDPSGD